MLLPRRSRSASGGAGVKLGVASYSLRTLSRGEAIAALGELRVPWVSIKSMHLPYDSPPAEIAAARSDFEKAGIEIVGGGVIYLQKNDEADVRRHFEYARSCGMPLMTIAPTAETLPLIERFVKQYDIAVAIHNHGPEDEHFPSPYEALEAIDGMDPRVGVCIDVGHTARTGVDLVKAVADSGDRLLDLHFKDLRDLAVKESQCVVGEGAMPTAGILKQLLAMGYDGYVNLEYEIDGADPVPGMGRSLAFMRGVLAGLTV
jgi:sugar phosphate isomerase/epimerase